MKNVKSNRICVVGILILLTLMNGDVATVNNDELSDIQYIKCTYY